MISVKEGVDLSNLSGESVLSAVVVDQVYVANGVNRCVITSGRDGTHMPKSKHYEGKALDFRTRDIAVSKIIKIRAEVAAALGADFDVVMEANHLHVEHDHK